MGVGGSDLLDLLHEGGGDTKPDSQSPSLCNWVGAHRKYVQFTYNVLDCGSETQVMNLVVSRKSERGNTKLRRET